MTTEELCRAFGVSDDTLRQCGSNDFSQKCGEECGRLGAILSLLSAGVDADTMISHPDLVEGGSGCEERLRVLKRCRCRLLDEIHERQRSLDSLDYLIRKTKEGSRASARLRKEAGK